MCVQVEGKLPLTNEDSESNGLDDTLMELPPTASPTDTEQAAGDFHQEKMITLK